MHFGRWASVDGLRSMGFGQWTSVDGLRSMGFGRWASVDGLRRMVFGRWTSAHRLRRIHFGASSDDRPRRQLRRRTGGRWIRPAASAEDAEPRRQGPRHADRESSSGAVSSCDAPSPLTVGHPGLRHRHAFTDRDHVDDVPRQASASDATIVPHPKNADGRPLAGSNGSTKGLMHPAARRLLLRSATGRRDGNHPVRQVSPKAAGAGGMGRDGRTRIGRVVQEARDPWRCGCRRRGAASAFPQDRRSASGAELRGSTDPPDRDP
jgi:hypothetical protein